LGFQRDSELAILFFKTAGFNRSPTPPFLSIACNSFGGIFGDIFWWLLPHFGEAHVLGCKMKTRELVAPP
jgi:hypothetical protein